MVFFTNQMTTSLVALQRPALAYQPKRFLLVRKTASESNPENKSMGCLDIFLGDRDFLKLFYSFHLDIYFEEEIVLPFFFFEISGFIIETGGVHLFISFFLIIFQIFNLKQLQESFAEIINKFEI